MMHLPEKLTLQGRAVPDGGTAHGFSLHVDLDLRPLLALLGTSVGGASAVGGVPTLLAYAAAAAHRMGQRVGYDRAASTWRKYRTLLGHLQRYAALEPRVATLLLRDVDEALVRGFDAYLQAQARLAAGTRRLYLCTLKSLLHRAALQGHVRTDAFADFRLPSRSHCRMALTAGQVETLSRMPLRGMARRVRDLFVWCCMTGLAYTDLCRLRPQHVEATGDGGGWITEPRRKTGQVALIRLTPQAMLWLQGLPKCGGQDAGCWIAVPDNRTVNRHLRRLGHRLQLEQPLHFHVARHTFATLLIGHGVPIETVSRMLGHARITTTQVYAEVTKRKIVHDTQHLTAALGPLAAAIH